MSEVVVKRQFPTDRKPLKTVPHCAVLAGGAGQGREGSLIDRVIIWLARLCAIAGGVMLIGLVGLTTVSVTGRALTPIGLGPVPGDFELVEMGTAFAIFAFLPWCHLTGGHASVDLLVSRFQRPAQRWLEVMSQALMLGAAAVLAWRLALGMLDKKEYGDTTYLLQVPVWWGYAAAMAGATVFVLVALRGLFAALRDR